MRVSSALIALSTLLPLVAASYFPRNGCQSNEFWWGTKQCCLPYGGPSSPPAPPQGIYCPPNGYYWHKEKGCCAPKNPPQPNYPPPQCSKGNQWYSALHYCIPEPHQTTTYATHKPSPTPAKPYGGHHGGDGHDQGSYGNQGHGQGSYGNQGNGKGGENHGYSGRGEDF